MDFNFYQDEAKKTIQKNSSNGDSTEIVPFLGIIGEIGSVVSQLKIKLRVGDSYVAYKSKLGEELGDVLWYLSTIASQNDLILEEIAERNLDKIKDRFLTDESASFADFDKSFPDNEKFPDEFEIEFISYEEDGKNKLKIMDKRTGNMIGDPLTDNTYEEDGYRFHDIFHYGYLAVLGRTPVVRELLHLKRKSVPNVDENEVGARSQIPQELISLSIYHHALDHNLLQYCTSVDSGLIKQVQNLVKNTEVKECSGKQWEKAILSSYEIFNKLRKNNGGRVLVSRKNRSLIYLGVR